MTKLEFEGKKMRVVEKRLEPMYEIAKSIGFADDIDFDELEMLVLDCNVKPSEYEKTIRTIVYAKHRLIYRKSRVEAFKIAFPERYKSSSNRNTIETKARRVEEYKVYKRIVSLVSASMYVSYMADRFMVLDLALEKIYDKRTKDRDRIEYMKVFLQETRKPEEMKGLEVNINVNNVQINRIEEKMNEISSKLEGLSADKVLEIMNGNK
jgi:hypothetical protein